MTCLGIFIVSTLIALTASAVAAEPGKRPPAQIFRNRDDYLKAVYGSTPGSWVGTTDLFATEIVIGVHPFRGVPQQVGTKDLSAAEILDMNNGIVGGTVPETPAITRFCEESPKTANDLEGIVRLFDWYMDRKQDPAALRMIFQGYTGSKAGPEVIYCNQHVLMFRTLLAHRGFISRPVIFDFTDGPGLAAHTFMEVWDPRAGKWLWFDPYYETYSRTLGTGELVAGDRRLAPQISIWYPKTMDTDAERAKRIDPIRETMVKQFWGQPSGWQAPEPAWAKWYVENGKTGERIEYRDPKYYKE